MPRTITDIRESGINEPWDDDDIVECLDCGGEFPWEEWNQGMHEEIQYIGDYAHSFMTDAPRCPRCGSDQYVRKQDWEDD